MVVAGLLAACMLVAPAVARGAADHEAPESGDQAARALLARAIAEYDAGRFLEARALFRRAQQESPSARTLRGIGMASFELRDYVAASRALGMSLKETRHPL